MDIVSSGYLARRSQSGTGRQEQVTVPLLKFDVRLPRRRRHWSLCDRLRESRSCPPAHSR